MAYSSLKEKNRAKSIKKGMVFLTFSLGILIAVTLFNLHLRNTRVELDADTLCPTEGPNGVVAILIDSTDPFTSVQKDYLIKYFDEMESSLMLGVLVQIYSASSYSESSFEPVASLCNPGDGSGVSELTANPRRIKEKWKNLFDMPLKESLLSSIEASAADASPLMAMIKALSVKAFPVASTKIPLKFYMVSDMLEHTQNYSQYQGTFEFQNVSQQPFFSHLSPNLSGVEVTVLYIARPGAEHLQTKGHAQFWSEYFQFVGSSLQVIKKI